MQKGYQAPRVKQSKADKKKWTCEKKREEQNKIIVERETESK